MHLNLRRWGKQKCDRGREWRGGRQCWSSLTLTESIFWQASASCNNLEIISIHKGPAVWQSKCSVADRSLRFSQLPVSVCAGPTSISAPTPLSIESRIIKWGRGWKGESRDGGSKTEKNKKGVEKRDSNAELGSNSAKEKENYECYWNLKKIRL